MVKCLPAMQETQVQFLGWKDPLEKEMTTNSCVLALKIPWKEEPGRIQSIESQRVRHERNAIKTTMRYHLTPVRMALIKYMLERV